MDLEAAKVKNVRPHQLATFGVYTYIYILHIFTNRHVSHFIHMLVKLAGRAWSPRHHCAVAFQRFPFPGVGASGIDQCCLPVSLFLSPLASLCQRLPPTL